MSDNNDILEVTTLQLWPMNAIKILHSKGLHVEKLKKKFTNIIFPWDSNYDQQRMLFSTQIQERPLFIIKACNKEEIIKTLNLLAKYCLTIRIVGGRHSVALNDPEVFLDMSLFTKIKFDKYLKVGAGNTQGMINDYLFKHYPDYYIPGTKPNRPHSLIFPGGSAASVGVAGISTIGGIGPMVRTVGLAIDSIQSFKIVIPPDSKHSNACIVKASKEENCDLFWALLGGGGGNFGVVTEISFYPVKINKVILYEITWPFYKAKKIINLWQCTAPKRNYQFNEDLAIYNAIDDDLCKFGISLTGIYVVPECQSYKEAKVIVAKEIEYLGGSVKIHKTTSYSDMYKSFVTNRVYHSYSIGKTILTMDKVCADDLINSIEVGSGTNGYVFIGIQLMGGKVFEIAPNETAYYPRHANFFVDIFNFWNSAVDQEKSLEWSNKTFKKLYKEAGPYIYLGFPITGLPNYLEAYYGKNKKRLLEIKHDIDPMNLLKYPGSL
jgi:hypothetical protein